LVALEIIKPCEWFYRTLIVFNQINKKYCSVFCLESLILAQNERWRQA
jgi:hypothetical protein